MASRKHRDWDRIMDRLNRSARGEILVKMGSPGSAQVTAVRLRREWDGIEVRVIESTLLLRLVE